MNNALYGIHPIGIYNYKLYLSGKPSLAFYLTVNLDYTSDNKLFKGSQETHSKKNFWTKVVFNITFSKIKWDH